MVRQLGCAVLRQALKDAHYNLEARAFVSTRSSLLDFWCSVAEVQPEKILSVAKKRGYTC